MARSASLFTADLVLAACRDAFGKLDPRQLVRNPVMFVTACVAALLTLLLVVGHDGLAIGFKLQLVLWLWLTVLFGTFAEALAEGRGKAQAASLRAAKAELTARRIKDRGVESVPASALRVGDIVLVETGDLIPSDGEVIDGVASVRIGRRVEIEFSGEPDLQQAQHIADKLLANPVIEEFSVRVEETVT